MKERKKEREKERKKERKNNNFKIIKSKLRFIHIY